MKRWGIWLLSLLLIGVVFYAFVYYKPIAKSENNWTLYHADDVCLMSLPIRNIDYSPILTAVFLTRLREGNLPLTFNFSVMSAEEILPSDTLLCVLKHQSKVLESPLSEIKVTPKDGNYLYVGKFEYDISDLLATMDEMEILEWMKTFPVAPESIVQYVGTKKELSDVLN